MRFRSARVRDRYRGVCTAIRRNIPRSDTATSSGAVAEFNEFVERAEIARDRGVRLHARAHYDAVPFRVSSGSFPTRPRSSLRGKRGSALAPSRGDVSD